MSRFPDGGDDLWGDLVTSGEVWRISGETVGLLLNSTVRGFPGKTSGEVRRNSGTFWEFLEGLAKSHSLPARRKQLPPTSVGLVVQSSATGVTVAATPPCSAIRFRNPKVPRYLHQPTATPALGCLLQMRGKCDRGVRRKVRHLDFGWV